MVAVGLPAIGWRPVDQLEEMTVQVDRVNHHRVIHQLDPNALVVGKLDRLGDLVELLAVERPHIAFHIAGQMDGFHPRRTAIVRIRFGRHKLCVVEHTVVDVVETKPREVHPIDGAGGNSVDPRPGLDIGR